MTYKEAALGEGKVLEVWKLGERLGHTAKLSSRNVQHLKLLAQGGAVQGLLRQHLLPLLGLKRVPQHSAEALRQRSSQYQQAAMFLTYRFFCKGTYRGKFDARLWQRTQLFWPLLFFFFSG